MKKMAFLAAAIAGCDQAVKMAVRRMPQGTLFFRVPGWVEITHCANTGAAFGLLSGKTALVTWLSAFLLIAVFVYAVRSCRLTRSAKTAFSCLIGGGVGNLIDRMLFGEVTDYIRVLLFRFPVFNLADIMIMLSIAALMLLLLLGRLEETSEEKDERHS